MTAGLTDSVSGADSAAPRLNLHLALCSRRHVPRGAGGRGSGGARKALIRRAASRVEGGGSVRRGDRAATWQKEAERDHFLALSLIPSFPFPSPHPSGHPQRALVISRSTGGCCVHLCERLRTPSRRPAILSPLCSIRLSVISTTFGVCDCELSFIKHVHKVRMRRGKAPASIFLPLLSCSCP